MYTLQQFSNECHRILAEDAGVEGRKKVCALVQEILKDDNFVALGHVNHGARESKPHDHGPSWAIYGQARGKTVMSDWELLEPATEDRPGKVRLVGEYALTPGVAHLYNEGDLHSPRRDGPTKLIRIEGRNLEKIRRLAYEAV
jgi:hypothetical protein